MPETRKRSGAYLPHWTKEGGIYAVQFRLADSIPQEKREQLELEIQDIKHSSEEMRGITSALARLRLLDLQRESVQKFLRNGYGDCFLKQDSIAAVVAGALQFFEGKRYRLLTWCIMPNHVHVVVAPLPGENLSRIVQSWKTFSAKEANKLLQRSGTFWMRETYDHLIRNDNDLLHAIEYTWSNSDLAGMRGWKWRWRIADADLDTLLSGLEAR